MHLSQPSTSQKFSSQRHKNVINSNNILKNLVIRVSLYTCILLSNLHFHVDLPFSSLRFFPICLLRFLISPVLFSSVMRSLHCHASFYLSQHKQTPLIFQDADSPFLGNLHWKGEPFANTENPVPMPGKQQWFQQLLKPLCPLRAVQLISPTSDFLQNSRNQWQTGLNASWHTSFIYPMRYYPKGKEAEGNNNLTDYHRQSKRLHRRKEISH